MTDSIHEKIKRVRKPRVHITYDLEANGITEEKELPFVLGVMGDYSGDNTEHKKTLKERKFTQIDEDNFDDLMGKINPQLNFKVSNRLQDNGSEIPVHLDFNCMEDFEPHRLVAQIEPLSALLGARNKLRDLLTKADRSEDLERVLEDILNSSEALTEIGNSLNVSSETENH